jgi:biotin transport system substrate-specific component
MSPEVPTLALTLAPPRSRQASRVAFQAACAVAGSVLLAGLAQLTIHLPFTPVPITGQTLGVLIVGAAYGPWLGAATVGLYLIEAVFGLPVLALTADGSHPTGLHVLTLSLASGGYLWGFVLAAAFVGWLARRGWDRSFRSAVGAMFLGEVAIYAVGLPWLAASVHVRAEKALEWGLYPFVLGDALKLLAAAAVLPGAWRALERFRPDVGTGQLGRLEERRDSTE